MPKKREPVDDVLDAIVWMRRKSKKHEAVDEFIDALLSMRRQTKKRAKRAKRDKRVVEPPQTRASKQKSKASDRTRAQRKKS